jgi:hypothetical protein
MSERKPPFSRSDSLEAGDYAGTERRISGPIGRSEFDKFVSCTLKSREENAARFDRHETILNKLHVAMFAKDDDNENGQPGLMVTAKNIDNHITAVCSIANALKLAVIGICGILIPLAGVAKAFGWL